MFAWNPMKWIGVRTNGKHSGPAALATCRSLVKLLAGLQQHRGMSTAWLSGGSAFEARMQQRRRDIDALIPALRPSFQSETEESCPCFTLNDWKLFQFKWRDLVDKLPGASSQENIERHNHLISRLLEWLAALGESRLELPAEGRLPPGLAANFASRLPALTECLGQARALGASVAAQGGCSPVARVRLNFLVARAETLLQKAVANDHGTAECRSAQSLVLAMANLVRSDLLAATEVRVSSERYFDAASQAIDAVLAWIDRSGMEMERALWQGQSGTPAGVHRPAFG